MSDLDLKSIFATLVNHFASSQTSMVLNPLNEDDDDVADLYEIFDKDGTDMGVTKFRTVNDQELMKLLNFPEGRLVLFPSLPSISVQMWQMACSHFVLRLALAVPHRSVPKWRTDITWAAQTCLQRVETSGPGLPTPPRSSPWTWEQI